MQFLLSILPSLQNFTTSLTLKLANLNLFQVGLSILALNFLQHFTAYKFFCSFPDEVQIQMHRVRPLDHSPKANNTLITSILLDTLRYHAIGGPLPVSEPKFRTPLADAFLEAAHYMGHHILDINAGIVLGKVHHWNVVLYS